jgi:hypothetical protein
MELLYRLTEYVLRYINLDHLNACNETPKASKKLLILLLEKFYFDE